MKRRIAFINASGDTFTPTKSGSLGPWIWEVCQAAQRQGIAPYVISKSQTAEPFPWPDKTIVEWPWVPQGKLAELALRANRKLCGWPQFGQGMFARRVAGAIIQAGLESASLFLQNDPEMTVYFRKRFPKARLISHFQNQQETWPQFRKSFAGTADVVTACSSFTARWIEQYYSLPLNSVRTIHSGVDSGKFKPAENIEQGAVINFTGRTGIEKAPDLLLRAALQVARRTKDFSLQIIGASVSGWSVWNPFQQQIKDLWSELEASGIAVRWPGHIDRFHIVGELQRACIHVVPSRWDEPFGLVTLEGMACGLATVASRTGGTPEVLGDAGILFTRDAEDELAEHLYQLVINPALREQYAKKGRARAEEFTWDRTWGRIAELLPE